MDRERTKAHAEMRMQSLAERLHELFPDFDSPQAVFVQALLADFSSLQRQITILKAQMAGADLASTTFVDVVRERYGQGIVEEILNEVLARVPENLKKLGIDLGK